jgi:hypothetical protein
MTCAPPESLGGVARSSSPRSLLPWPGEQPGGGDSSEGYSGDADAEQSQPSGGRARERLRRRRQV